MNTLYHPIAQYNDPWDNHELGKIEDAGKIVHGGGIDRHWLEVTPEKKFKAMFGKNPDHKWLFDSTLALEHFNLRSIEFGNWMTQQDRANFLYAACLSLHHLAIVLEIKDSEIGLFGRLSLALGARGHGNARAHYEPTPYGVINLTKTMGFGSLAHEYAHALDNIISYVTNSSSGTMVTGGHITRKGYNTEIAKNGNFFEQQFEEFFNRLYFDTNGNQTGFVTAIENYNEGDYMQRRAEVFARSFEVYIYNLLRATKIKDVFLIKPIYNINIYPDQTLSKLVKTIIDRIVKKGFIAIRKNKLPLSLQGITTATGYKGFRTTLKNNANLNDTLEAMKRIALGNYIQVQELAKELEGNTLHETAENIWNYLRTYTRYKLDRSGIEELRTPARSLVDGEKGLTDTTYGIDCDDYTILISAILLNLGIKHQYQVVAYEEQGKFQHIYPVAFDALGNRYVIDVVPEIPHFNYEEKPIIDLKIIPMELHELSGVTPMVMEEMPVTESEIKNDYAEEMNQPYQLEGIEDDYEDTLLESSFLSGFDEVYSEDDADIILHGTSDTIALLERGIFAEVNKAKQTLVNEKNKPTVLSQLINVSKELQLIDDVMQSWDNQDERHHAIQSAIASKSQYTNFFRAIKEALDRLEDESLQGFNDTQEQPIYLARIPKDAGFLQDVLEDEDDQDMAGLGYVDSDFYQTNDPAPLSGFFKKIFRKIGKGIKKVIKAVVRFNPLTLVMRGAIILVLKINLFKFAQKLIYGYLTEAQAQAQGLDINEWRKVVGKLRKAEKFFTKIGGRASKFRKAIVRGKAAKKTGLQISGLGVVVTGTSTAAASGFIAFVGALLKSINPAKLFKKIKAKVAAKRKENQTPSVSYPQTTPQTFNPSPADFDANSANASNQINTPTVNTGVMSKIKQFFTTHKKKVLIIGIAGVLAVIVAIFYNKSKKKQKRSLSGIKAAKTRARNRNRMKTISKGTRKRKSPTPLKGSSTTLRLPSKTLSRAKVRKTSNATRLRAMHKKAKELQIKHPKTKYSTLLQRASKQI